MSASSAGAAPRTSNACKHFEIRITPAVDIPVDYLKACLNRICSEWVFQKELSAGGDVMYQCHAKLLKKCRGQTLSNLLADDFGLKCWVKRVEDPKPASYMVRYTPETENYVEGPWMHGGSAEVRAEIIIQLY
jgi:hypothetical protein